MKRPNPDNDAQKSDVTRELTGTDAPRDEAEQGSAGNGASPWGADRTGVRSEPGFEDEYHLEGDPSSPADIIPDKLEAGFSDPDEDDRQYTARPDDDLRPIGPDLLPSDDEGARE
jgi:hypothetical protein